MLEKRFFKDEEIARRYRDVFMANVEKGYLQKVSDVDLEKNSSWFRPHFPVVREDKTTTKVRIVHDSAAKTGNMSLNDVMMNGPNLQNNIVEILIMFRTKPVALVGDIKEMFSQVQMFEDDRRYHRLLWRDDTHSPVETYEATRLMFGDKASPFLAQFVLRHHVNCSEENPRVSEVIHKQTYMDDLITSVENVVDATTLRSELSSVLSAAGFDVRRWCSNVMAVLDGLPLGDIEDCLKIVDKDNANMETLAVRWFAVGDYLTYSTPASCGRRGVPTKRSLLSCIATLFDPLQYLAPVVIPISI
ncbi:uncharacterized protein LOC141911548 [Tubulanus polymorphus]|uniref:uncharacterized protein LOC141911548 n=1 Tax=Tubulanus polymorphus TaxID=672921 RepID=UPI003DA56B47